MCRILLKTGKVDSVEFAKALSLMRNGGPDSTRIGTTNVRTLIGEVPVTYGHNRLAIRDLSPDSDQPVEWDAGVLLYNGEIYNQEDIENSLQMKKEKSDTLFLSKLIEMRRGVITETVSQLDMEGALIFIDRRSDKIKVYRDSRGTKSLYWYVSPTGDLTISSEIKPILDLNPGIQPDKEAIGSYLRWGFFIGITTPFEGIKKCIPGECTSFNISSGTGLSGRWGISQTNLVTPTYPFGGVDHRRSWQVYSIHASINEEFDADEDDGAMDPDMIESAKKTLEDSVSRRLISDVPVSCNLSGGLDSSILAYLMKKKLGIGFKTYTLEFSEDSDPESKKATDVAKWLGVENERITISSKNIFAGLDDIVRTIEEPCDKGSLIPTYFLARGTSEKVALIGEGADEVFLGYNRHLDHHEDPTENQVTCFREYYDTMPGNVTINPQYAYRYMTGDLQTFIGKHLESSATSISGIDLNTEIPCYHSVRIDKMFMRFGVEARLPYLSERVVHMGRISGIGYKIRDGVNKRMLREMFRGEIPDWILDQPKKALKIPYDQYVRLPKFKDLIYKNYLGIIDPSELDKLYATYDSGEEVRNRGRFLWLLVLINKWYEQFYGTKR